MAERIPNLWPDDDDEIFRRIHVPQTTAPVAILQWQAELLGQRTDNVVEAEVRSRSSRESDDFEYEFNLIAPALDDYVFHLFSIRHPFNYYPIEIRPRPGFFQVEGKKGFPSPSNEPEFLEALREILGSEETQGIIQSLIAQS